MQTSQLIMVHLVKFVNSRMTMQKSVQGRNRILFYLFSSISLYGMPSLPKATAKLHGHR